MYRKLVINLLTVSSIGISDWALAQSQDAENPLQTQLFTLGTIDGESTTQFSLVTIRLDQAPGWKSLPHLEHHGSFLQLKLPNTIVPDPGKFFDTSNPYFPKVGAFQISPSDAGIRFFSSDDYETSDILKAIKSEILGSRIVVSVDRSLLQTINPLKSQTMGPPFLEKNLPQNTSGYKDAAANHFPQPSSSRLSDAPQPSSDLKSHLNRLAAGAAFLLSLIIVAMGIKPFLRRRLSHRRSNTDILDLKTIASASIAPKQRVSVIQVGGQRILLGLTPDAITFLTVLSPEKQPSIHAENIDNRRPSLESYPSLKAARSESEKRLLPEAQVENFSDILKSESQTLNLTAAPRLKNIPGNDEKTLSQDLQSPSSPNKSRRQESPKTPLKQTERRGSRINISVGDDGIKKLSHSQAPQPSKSQPAAQETIDDITKIIRQKMKDFKSI